ncbi:MAG: dynamin family protein [Ignavibacteriales bacterium]|nr:hypothetical protein [Ignavibacteriaceae bacterium]QOJ28315.1 MAG: dynamin family protein [Ignavibacteriales bacterium]
MSIENKKANFKSKSEKLKSYYEKYSLGLNDIQQLIAGISDFSVVTPVIGGFSSGKSSLINAVLSLNLMPVEITPETAIPTEIRYSPNEQCQRLTEGKWLAAQVKEIRENKFLYSDTKLVKAFLNVPFLKEIPSVTLVDMPGLDSGIEAHNRAIDDYLLNSLAYIITVDSEQGLTESVILFLKELKLLSVPILVVLTKTDKRSKSDVDAMFEDVKNKMEQYTGVGKFQITTASARKQDVEQVRKFLTEIQNQADSIFENAVSQKLNSAISVIEKYLTTRVNKDDFTIEEIAEKEKLLKKQIEELEIKIDKEKETLSSDIEKCITLAEGKIKMRLEGSTASIVSDLLANRDPKTQINSLVRVSILESIQTEITPRIQRFFNTVSDLSGIELEINSHLDSDPIKGKVNDLMKDSIKKVTPLILAGIGFAFAGPIGALVAGVLSVITDIFFEKKKQDDARRTAEEKVRNEIVPQVSSQAIASFRTSIAAHLSEIVDKLHESITKDKEMKEKALDDLRAQKNKAIEEQNSVLAELQEDLSQIQELKN